MKRKGVKISKSLLKSFLLVNFLLFVFINVSSQSDDYHLEQLKKKYQVTKTMKYGGMSTFCGGGLIVIGSVVYMQVDQAIYNKNHDYWDDGSWEVPAAIPYIASFGAFCLPVGLTFWIIGNKTKPYFEKKLRNYYVSPLYTPNYKGLTLSYNF